MEKKKSMLSKIRHGAGKRAGIAALLLSACALSWPQIQPGTPPVQAQSPSVPFPLLPLIAEYEYVPHYFMQRLNDHPQYAMIEAAVTDSNPPVYNLVLTEKGSRRRVNYCNSEARVKGLLS